MRMGLDVRGIESDPRDRAVIDARAGVLFRAHQLKVFRETDRLFAALLTFQWEASIIVALLVSPRAWAGETSNVHIHVWAALFLGGVIVSLPIALALLRPGATSTRHVIAVGQALMGALLIHLTGGRIETHFHIFGSLALLAFYRDWRVLATFTVVVVLDHLLRGTFWPYSVYGVLTVSRYRWIEHAGWVLFEDAFLIRSCVQSVREMRAVAERQSQLEITQQGIEQTVRERTIELQRANQCLVGENAERIRAEAALRGSEARFRSLCACSPIGIFTTDRDGLCVYVNPRAQAIAGFSREQALGNGWQAFVHEDDLERVVASWRAACAERREFDESYRYRGTNTSDRWAHVRTAPMLDDRDQFIGQVGTIEDTTDRKAAEDNLAHQAMHDALTGLPNRACFQQNLEREIASARGQGGGFALLLIDLDRFKEINDTFGHHHGDAVLRELNPRLREVLRRSDLLARLGGDEFAALLPGADAAAASRTAARILESLGRPIVFEGHELEVGASIGIALFPAHGADVSTLMRHADAAMYEAKRDHGGYRVYAADDRPDGDPRRLTLVTELRHGIQDDELVLYYQPKIDLKTMTISGAEALVRWDHPREGLIAPDRFIPLAEHAGLINPLALWVLRDAFRQSRLWREGGLALNIALNLAPKNLRDPKLMDAILQHREGPEPLLTSLTLEITEGTMMENPAETREVLAHLHDMGVRISIDDFGTGYSSLAYLDRLPVDELKIDRCFVMNATRSEKDACIVRSVIDLGHNLGLRVVAEGVEDRATLELLAAWGCDIAQGYHFARPLPASQFEDWVAASILSRPPLPMWNFLANPASKLVLQHAHE